MIGRATSSALFLLLLSASSVSLADADVPSRYTTPAGKSYLLATSTPVGVSCEPVPHGFACSVDGKTLVSVRDRWGCGLVREGSTCVLASDLAESISEILAPGASTLECQSGSAFRLSAGPEASCDANNGLAMTCTSTDGQDFAQASCAAGCSETTGLGDCQLHTEPR